MVRKACQHGSVLPRGLRCNHSYLEINLWTDQGKFFAPGGPHTPQNEKIARLALDDIRVKQRLGTFNLPSKATRIKFQDAFKIFFQRHYQDWRDPNTHEPRAQGSLVICTSMSKHLLSYFGEFYLDSITVKSINDYKRYRVETEDCSHSTFNKEKGLLSSLMNVFKVLVKGEEIRPLRLPDENPCNFVPDLTETPRDRFATTTELGKLKVACGNDLEMWTIILFALDTCLRLGDLRKAAGQEGVIHMRQGKTKGKVTLPASPFAKVLTQESFKGFEYRWNKARKAAGVEDLQFRDFRRTGATLAKMGGATTALIKDTLGHADSKTTEWYLNIKDPVALQPLVLARRKILESL